MTFLETAPWMIWTVLLPLCAGICTFLFQRAAPWLGVAAALGNALAVAALAAQVLRGGSLRYPVGGWGVPLGIDLRADGLSTLMLAMSAVIGVAVSVYAARYFSDEDAEDDLEAQRHKRAYFWPLWMFLLAGLNGLFLSADIFHLYVTLELLGFSAVSLAALAGQRAALVAAMRYLLVSLLGSLCFLFGVALLYAAYATVDVTTLAGLAKAGPITWTALGLMTGGLLMKSAVFPLHFWLPPAHANAPAPVSALLSALVVKASFYILLRLWFELFRGVVTLPAANFLGLLGAAAILWGSFQALRVRRLKLLVAYSTVAQLGYLCLLFPLAQNAGVAFTAWSGCIYFMLAHACAKAAMFLAAGNMAHAAGHDRIAGLDGITQALPLSVTAFMLAGISLIGLPPSGGFIAKWMLLKAAIASGQWGWALLMLAGSLLAAGYVMRVLRHAFTQVDKALPLHRVPRTMEWTAAGLAVLAVLLGLMAARPLALLRIGAPVADAAVAAVEGGPR